MTEPDEPARPEGLPDLVARALEVLEGDGAVALETFLAGHPRDAVAVRQRISALRRAGFLEDPARRADPPEHVGPFRLLRRLGGGGMGVVYLAEQEGLERKAAVKLVRPELLLMDGARERFRREVAALARMHHPGIVTVFAGGEEVGAPYLAMEWVAGATLHEILGELGRRDPTTLRGQDLQAALRELVARHDRADPHPASAADGAPPAGTGTQATDATRRLFVGTWVAACLRIAQAIAEALVHAHERGVLHRDVKPSNIMVSLDGRVRLIDFGLARADGAESLTRTGAHLGSAAYMSREQIQGDHALVDERSDVYSLGVTLYELLTLRPAFARETIESTCAAVLAGDARPPRSLNPALPRDAETVCLTAMDRDRGRRYPSAAEFVADLASVLELRPIAASRLPFALRSLRWAQRRPGAAVALLAGVLMLFGGPAVWFAQERRAAGRIQAALDARTLALAQVSRERDRSREVIDRLLTAVAEEELLAVPRMQPLRRRLLESALGFEEQMLLDAASDATTAMQFAAAAAGMRVARLRNELGESATALAVLLPAEQRARAAVAEAPADQARRDLLIRLLAMKGEVQQVLGRLDEALAAIDESLALAAAVAERAAAAAREDGRALRRRANLLGEAGRVEEALAMHQAYQVRVDAAVAAAITAEEREGWQYEDLANRGLHASLLLSCGRLAKAIAATSQDCPTESPLGAGLGLQVLRVRLLAIRASALQRANRSTEASIAGEQALAVIDELLADFPDAAEPRRIRAAVVQNLAMIANEAGDPERARQQWRQSVDALRELLAADPQSIDVRQNLAIDLVNLCSMDLEGGDPAAARRQVEEAVQLAEQVLEQNPARPGAAGVLFNGLWYLGLACRDLGDHRAASAAVRRLPEVMTTDPRAARIAAEIIADCRSKVAEDATLDDASRVSLLDENSELVIGLLRRAVTDGCGDVERVAGPERFAPYRDHPAFAQILAGLRRNAAPRAP